VIIHRPEGVKSPAEYLAPRWHTAALIGLMLAVAAVGTTLGRHGVSNEAPARGGRLGVYLPILLVQWSLALYVCRVGRARNALPDLLGRGWRDVRRAATDTALAAAGWVLIEASEAAFHRLEPSRSAGVLAILPHTGAERIAWVVVAASVGFCEEVVYRGYLQTQLAGWTGNVAAAILAQAALFGLAHGEQGAAVAARFALYGVGFGVLARWRGSLAPGIVCHIGVDLASGLLG
jgi:membrane protease YdiL (CAAX protease family)